MEGRTVPVVVTASGRSDVDIREGMTAKELKEQVMAAWGIDRKKVNQAFVVVNSISGHCSFACEDETVLSERVTDTSILRVVLPLAEKE